MLARKSDISFLLEPFLYRVWNKLLKVSDLRKDN